MVVGWGCVEVLKKLVCGWFFWGGVGLFLISCVCFRNFVLMS